MAALSSIRGCALEAILEEGQVQLVKQIRLHPLEVPMEVIMST
jgi:hypothetical protein